MKQSHKMTLALAVLIVICCAGVSPQLFAALLGIASIVLAICFVLGGFLFFTDHWEIGPPIVILAVLLIGSVLWPPLLGVVIGVGAVGGLFLIVYSVIKSRGG